MSKINLKKSTDSRAIYGTPAQRRNALNGTAPKPTPNTRTTAPGSKSASSAPRNRAPAANNIPTAKKGFSINKAWIITGILLTAFMSVWMSHCSEQRKREEAERLEMEARQAAAQKAYEDSIALDRQRRYEAARHRANLAEAERQKKLLAMWKDYSWEDIIAMVHRNCPAYGGMEVYRHDNEHWLLTYSIATGKRDHLDLEIYAHYFQRFNPKTRKFQKAERTDVDYNRKQTDNKLYSWGSHRPLYYYSRYDDNPVYSSIDHEYRWTRDNLPDKGMIPKNEKKYKPYKPTREDIIYDAVYDRVSDEYGDIDDIDEIVDGILDDMGY